MTHDMPPLLLADNDLLRTGALIGDHWRSADHLTAYSVRDPASGHILASVRWSSAEDTEDAIEAAKAALPQWRRMPVPERSELLRRLHTGILANADDLALLITYESGKPLTEARAEVAYGASYIRWFAEQALRMNGEIIPAYSTDRQILVLREPVGVVACITPWNFPIAMLARKLAPALAAGCTLVCKPSEETPLSALALGVLCQRAGLPSGVVNFVSGDAAKIGNALVTSPSVRKLTFTGSTRVGKLLAEGCARTMKRTSMELGGNAPFIIFADADLDRAVSGVMSAKFRNAGQTCICANRILVETSILPRFLERTRAAMARLSLGHGAASGTSIGPLINAAAADRVEGLIASAAVSGARVERFGNSAPMSGHFVQPALVSGLGRDAFVARDEIFGPVMTVQSFEDEEEAVEMANDTASGLAAYTYSEDYRRLLRVAGRLEVGMAGLNEAAISNEMAPFGGIKQSGYGREGSVHGLDDYLELKYLCLGGLS